MKRLAIIARNRNSSNRGLLEAATALGLDAVILPPEQAGRRLRSGDVALGRLDVLPTLDGPEPGLETLRSLEERGVFVLNRAGALLGTHDKLMTALRLAARGLPHPRTAHVDAAAELALEFPVVVKPRFGSWGRDVSVCRSRLALERCLSRVGRKAWFRRQGALVQALIQPQGYDLRILVAGGQIVGAVERIRARRMAHEHRARRRPQTRLPRTAGVPDCLSGCGRPRDRPRRRRTPPGRRPRVGRPRAQRRRRLHTRVQPRRRERL